MENDLDCPLGRVELLWNSWWAETLKMTSGEERKKKKKKNTPELSISFSSSDALANGKMDLILKFGLKSINSFEYNVKH